MNLSENFTLAEATKSQVAIRLNIDNSLTAVRDQRTFDVITCLKAVACNILQPIRDHFGVPFTPQSWFRCLELNRNLGSSDKSKHRKGQAVDIEVPGIDNLFLAKWIAENLDFDQLILEFYIDGDPSSGWVHVSYVSKKENRGEILTITPEGVSIVGLPD